MMPPRRQPPDEDEIELSLFGPGVGEAILLHVGDGNWIAVDSCLDASGDPVSLSYLRELQIDLSKLRLVVASHWHDDHVRGIGRMFAEASAAKFACSAAMNCKEFFQLIYCSEDVLNVSHTSGGSEFAHILEVLRDRAKSGKFVSGPDHWASSAKVLYEDRAIGVQVQSLSPSDQTVTDAVGQFAALIPEHGQPMRRFRKSATEPNDLSVTLLASFGGDFHILLGGDLEVGGTARHGWRAIIADTIASSRKSFAYKVPHHGSENADHEDIWSVLLAVDPHAAITPYASGRRPRPSDTDIRRLVERTKNLYCTVWPPTRSPPKRAKPVDRTLAEMTRTRVARHRTPGHIRVRRRLGTDAVSTQVQLFDGATRLK